MPQEVAPGVRLDGKVAVVTGANTGIGLETARALYERGARVVLAVRSLERGLAAREQLEREAADRDGLGSLLVMQLDLASLASVRSFAAAAVAQLDRLDLLINNAGVILTERQETEDGFETTFGVNHLGHFLLTLLLCDKLKASAPARVVVLSSAAYAFGSLHWDDLQLSAGYGAWTAYAQSKLANILFARELARRLVGSGVTVYAVHPGAVKTDIGRGLPRWFAWLMTPARVLFFKSAAQGARTTLHCALAPELAETSGGYYADCRETATSRAASSDEDARRLWQVSCQLVGWQHEDPTAAQDGGAADEGKNGGSEQASPPAGHE